MRKIILKITLIIIAVFVVFVVADIAATPDAIYYETSEYNTSSLLFDSNHYTQADDETINIHKGSLSTDDELISSSSNQQYDLYLNRTLGIFKVRNNTTNYIYSSAVESLNENDATAYYAGYMSSSFVIEYYSYIAREETNAFFTTISTLNTATRYSNSEKEELGELETYPYKINRTNNVNVTYQAITNGMRVSIRYNAIDISFNAYVTIDDQGLHVSVPDSEITEGNHKIASIIVMPALGATYNNQTAGYMVIPDGSGALIRYGSVNGRSVGQQTIPFYGSNLGSLPNTIYTGVRSSKNLSAPVFGLINGIRQDGVYGVIESGSYLADLVISPAGAYNINYNFLTAKYTKRFVYLVYGVNQTILQARNNEDINVNYRFLDGDDATYVGMANDYQEYLIERDELTLNDDQTYKTRIDLLMTETTSALIGTKKITMTSVDDATDIINDLKENGLDQLLVVFRGWNKEGFSGATPYDIKYSSSKSSYQKLIALLEDNNDQAYFYNDYVYGYSNGNISVRGDVARSTLNLKLTFRDSGAVYPTYHYLYPESSKRIMESDVSAYQKLGIHSLALDGISNVLFTYMRNGNHYTRSDGVSSYLSGTNTLSENFNIAMSSPNSYMYKYLSSYLNMSLYSTGYAFYSDTVPFIPYVLRGCVDYYSTYLNFQANSTNQVLRMLDYGAFPSYILTTQASYNLKYTDSVNYYTTSYSDWKDKIITNNILEGTYNTLLNKKIYDRQVLDSGVVRVVFEDVVLIVNYSNYDYQYANNTIPGNSYKIVEESL